MVESVLIENLAKLEEKYTQKFQDSLLLIFLEIQ